MRVTIKGRTPSTISFNTLGIVLRGVVEAKSIELKNDAQIREVNSVCNAGLIEVIREESIQIINPIIVPKAVIVPKANPPEVTKVPETPTVTETVEEVEEVEEVEDAPVVAPKAKAKAKGRPKGSKDKTPRKTKAAKTAKVEKETKAVKKAASPIKKLEPVLESTIKNKSEDEPEGRVVVMTPGGAVTGKMVKSVTGDMPDCEATQASLQALKDMEAEEKAANEAEEVVEDQSKLDPSERTGGKAVVATGDRQAASVELKNSILPQAEAIKNAKKFIQLDEPKDKSADAFIDKNEKVDANESDEDEEGDNFLEV